MKKILFTLTFFGLLAFSTPVLAQQQINNDGATGGEIQQQVGGEYFQQNSNGQQTSGVSNNAGASVIQNAPNQPLEVSGAPANTTTTQDSKSSLRWVLIFGAIFLLLLSPALLYVRDMQKTGEITDDILVMKAPKEETVAKEPAKEEVKPAKKKSTKAKKSTGSKAKRGKKKK